MKFGLLSAVAALALLLCACGQKETKAPAAPTDNAAPGSSSTATSTPDTATPPATSEASNAPVRRFEAKSGRIEFTLTGMQEGTETLTWDDYGARTVTETKSSVSFPGMPAAAAAAASQEQRIITKADSMISLDLKTKTGTKIDGFNEKAAAMMGKDPSQLQQMSEDMMTSMGATKSGSETVAGKPCDLWTAEQMMGMTVCVWKGAALKTEGNMMGTKISKVATKIEENIAVDQALFEIPADFTISEAPMAGQMPPGLSEMMKGMPSPPAPPAASAN